MSLRLQILDTYIHHAPEAIAVPVATRRVFFGPFARIHAVLLPRRDTTPSRRFTAANGPLPMRGTDSAHHRGGGVSPHSRVPEHSQCSRTVHAHGWAHPVGAPQSR